MIGYRAFPHSHDAGDGGSFTLVDLKAAYNPVDPVKIEVGVTNLMDRNYVFWGRVQRTGPRVLHERARELLKESS